MQLYDPDLSVILLPHFTFMHAAYICLHLVVAEVSIDENVQISRFSL